MTTFATATANKTFFRVLVNPLKNGDTYIIESEVLEVRDQTVYAEFLFNVLQNTASKYKFGQQNKCMHSTPEGAFDFLMSEHPEELLQGRLWVFAREFGGGICVPINKLANSISKHINPLFSGILPDILKRKSQKPSASPQKAPKQSDVDSLQPAETTKKEKVYTAVELSSSRILPLGKAAHCVSGPLKGAYVTKNKNGHLVYCTEALEFTAPVQFGPTILESKFVLVEEITKKKEWKLVSAEKAFKALDERLPIKILYMNTERYIQKSDETGKVKFSTKGAKERIVSTREVMISLAEILSAEFYVLSE